MSDPLSSRQESILNFIKAEIQKRGYPPAVREIGAAVGLSSSSTVHAHLNQLESKGYIRRDPTKPRAIEVVDFRSEFRPQKGTVGIPMLGRVTAGQPVYAFEDPDAESFLLPEDFLDAEPSEVFMLTVQGDSMLNAGIHDGDYVVVHKQSTANNGEIVAAMLEDEATIKRFYKAASHVRLQPENDLYEPILTKNVQILGKVIALIRRY
jgi:repressor LexA